MSEEKKVFLSLQLFGVNGIQVSAFKNEEATTENKQPHYRGEGIAIWVKEYEEKPKRPKPVEERL